MVALGTDSLGLGPQEGTAQPPEPHRSGQERVPVRLVALWLGLSQAQAQTMFPAGV